jgi:hypothetical protein
LKYKQENNLSIEKAATLYLAETKPELLVHKQQDIGVHWVEKPLDDNSREAMLSMSNEEFFKKYVEPKL